MSKKLLEITELARVEGETALQVTIESGEIDVRLDIWEPPRFFEGFLIGRDLAEAPEIVSRICGLCPVAHQLCAVSAIENALGVELDRSTKAARRLLELSQTAASHLVHLYALTLPDYVGVHSVDDLMTGAPTLIDRLLRMKKVFNDLTSALGGRPVHPVTIAVGGFSKSPDHRRLNEIKEQLTSLIPDTIETFKLFHDLELPMLDHQIEHISLAADGGLEGSMPLLVSSSGKHWPQNRYQELFAEREDSYAMAKKSFLMPDLRPFFSGALARLNNKYLSGTHDIYTADVWEDFCPSINPFHNIRAQALEVVAATRESIELISNWQEPKAPNAVCVKSGEGQAIIEAPRGLLYYRFALNNRGLIEQVNIVTPTAHNFAAIEDSIRMLVSDNPQLPQVELAQLAEKLIRAYDPCFSCSVH